jgi:hypothetical protein
MRAVNVDDENAVRGAFREALAERKKVVLDNPGVPADELLAFAEKLRADEPDEYGSVRVAKAGDDADAGIVLDPAE